MTEQTPDVEAAQAQMERADERWFRAVEVISEELGVEPFEMPEEYPTPLETLAWVVEKTRERKGGPSEDRENRERMRWDGSRASISEMCQWVNADYPNDPALSYITTARDGVTEVLLWTPLGLKSLTPGDWIVRSWTDEFYRIPGEGA